MVKISDLGTLLPMNLPPPIAEAISASLRSTVTPDAQLLWEGDVNRVWKFAHGESSVILKIGPRLAPERDRLHWLDGRLPVPKVIHWESATDAEYMLIGVVPGQSLADAVKTVDPAVIAQRLAAALRVIHSTPVDGCPFVNGESGDVLVHGDACLPNLMFDGERWSGAVDVGDFGRGHRETDLAAAVWSLQRNMGPGWGRAFLEAYGLENTTDEEVERLRRAY